MSLSCTQSVVTVRAGTGLQVRVRSKVRVKGRIAFGVMSRSGQGLGSWIALQAKAGSAVLILETLRISIAN